MPSPRNSVSFATICSGVPTRGPERNDSTVSATRCGSTRRRVLPHRVAETVESFRSGPLVGTPEQIVAKLTELRGLGMTYAITYFAEAAYDTSGIELFEREVVPALR